MRCLVWCAFTSEVGDEPRSALPVHEAVAELAVAAPPPCEELSAPTHHLSRLWTGCATAYSPCPLPPCSCCLLCALVPAGSRMRNTALRCCGDGGQTWLSPHSAITWFEPQASSRIGIFNGSRVSSVGTCSRRSPCVSTHCRHRGADDSASALRSIEGGDWRLEGWHQQGRNNKTHKHVLAVAESELAEEVSAPCIQFAVGGDDGVVVSGT